MERVRVKLRRTKEEMEPILEVFKTNWYSSIEAIAGLTDLDWEILQFPLHLRRTIESEVINSLSK